MVNVGVPFDLIIYPCHSSRSLKINFLKRKSMSFYMSTMSPKGLYSKIVKIFGVEKWWKLIFFLQNLPVFGKTESF